MTTEQIWQMRHDIIRQYPELEKRFDEIEPAMERSKCPECTRRKRLNFIANEIQNIK